MFKIASNFISVVLLISLLAAPLYFARNFAKISGVKTQSNYLIVSQIEKFPNLTLSQNANLYTITYQKYAQSQAFIGVLIVNNPTSQSQTYNLDVISGTDRIFFGENLEDQKTQITIPPGTTVPISLVSQTQSPQQSLVEFKIRAN